MDIRAKMRQIRDAKGAILVVGLGISGYETALRLSQAGYRVICVDEKSEESMLSQGRGSWADSIRKAGGEVLFGIQGEDIEPFASSVEMAVFSPGVSLETAIGGAVKRRGIPIINELELSLSIMESKTILVTGSNGKTTTATLIHHILSLESRVNPILCGNVGTPAIAYLKPNELTALESLKDR
ncbi:MAG: hypothetical protein D6808_08275, partial [Candidatus Dadabacteria bacterium]